MPTEADVQGFKTYLQSKWIDPNKATWQNANEYKSSLTQADLEAKIKSWNFSWADTSAYNKLTWNNQGARDVMLWSKDAMVNPNIKTAVTPQEIQTMKSEWVTQVNPNTTLDTTNMTQPEIKQGKEQALNQPVWQPLVEKTTVQTPEWTTTTTKETPKVNEIKPITDLATFKQAWVNLNNLQELIHNRPENAWMQTVIEWDKIIWTTADWKKYQWIIDKVWNPIKTEVPQTISSNDIFSQLQVNPNFNTSKLDKIEVDKAKLRLQSYNNYSNYTDKQLWWALSSWKLIAWTTVYNDLMNNPEMKIRLNNIETLNTINWRSPDITKVTEIQSDNILNNTKVEINWETMTMKKAMEDWYISADEMKSLYNNHEISSKQQEVQDLSNKTAELQSIYDWVEKRIEDQYQWLPKNVVAWIVARERNYLLWDLNLAIKEQNNAIWTLTQMKQDAWDLFATNLSLYQKQADRTYQEQQATKQLEQQYQYTYWDINSTNPTLQNIAIKNTLTDMYTKYPIPWMESMAVKEQKIQDLISWKTTWIPMTWSEAIASVESEIRNSQRYKDYINPPSEQMTPYQQAQIDLENRKLDWTAWTWWTTNNVQATWNIVSFTNNSWWQKTIKVDEIAKNPLMTALNEIGINNYFIWSQQYRTKEEQAKLVAEWKSWTTDSKHMTWLAVDLYSDNKLKAPTQKQIDIMAKNWWTRPPETVAKWDYGHFEYTWTQTTLNLSNLWQYMKDNQDRWQWFSNDDVLAFNEKIDRFVKNWDEKWMGLAYRNMIMKDKSFKDEFDNTQKFARALDDVSIMINNYEKAGKSTNALTAMAEKVARKAGITTDTALAQLQTQMWFTLANYIRSISGTAASDVEVQRLMWNMANIWNVKDLNTALVSQAKNNATSSLKSMIDTRMYWMPEDLKPKIFWDIYWKTTSTKQPQTTPTTWSINNNSSDEDIMNYLKSNW